MNLHRSIGRMQGAAGIEGSLLSKHMENSLSLEASMLAPDPEPVFHEMAFIVLDYLSLHLYTLGPLSRSQRSENSGTEHPTP